MHRPEGRPPNTYCLVCGAELKVEQLRRARVRGLFGSRQWQAELVCPQCGARSGGG